MTQNDDTEGALELKPCPFCGGAAKLITWHENTEARHIQCKECKCMTGAPHFCREFAFKDWNTRAETPKEPVDVEGLKTEIRKHFYPKMSKINAFVTIGDTVEYLAKQGYLQQPNQWQDTEAYHIFSFSEANKEYAEEEVYPDPMDNKYLLKFSGREIEQIKHALSCNYSLEVFNSIQSIERDLMNIKLPQPPKENEDE